MDLTGADTGAGRDTTALVEGKRADCCSLCHWGHKQRPEHMLGLHNLKDKRTLFFSS